MTPEQKKEILESKDFESICQKHSCNDSCPMFKEKEKVELAMSCKAKYFRIKFEAEKAKTKKLKEALEFYAEIQGANDELTLEDGERLYVVDIEDFDLVEWTHTCGSSYKVKTIGKRARQTLKELEE